MYEYVLIIKNSVNRVKSNNLNELLNVASYLISKDYECVLVDNFEKIEIQSDYDILMIKDNKEECYERFETSNRKRL